MNALVLLVSLTSLLGALGRQYNREIVATSKSIHSRFRQTDFPSIFPSKNLERQVVPLTSEYSSTGWVVNSAYTGSSCTEYYGSQGLPVNTCQKRNGMGSKLQLVDDSCDGAVIEYFNDLSCTEFNRTEALLLPTTCFTGDDDDSGLSVMVTCTTSANKIVQDDAVVFTYYKDSGCSTVGSYNTFATDVCLGSVEFSCSNDKVEVISYTAESCEGSAQTYPMPSTCLTDGDDDGDDGADDDDYYYSAGDAAESSMVTCSTGSSSGSNSLSDGAIAGIIIGGVVFLALFAAGIYFFAFTGSSATAVTSAPAVQMGSGEHAA